MNLVETLTVMTLLASFFIVGIKIFNITRQGKFYNPIWVFVGLAGYLINWLISLLIFFFNWGESGMDMIPIYQVFFVIVSFFFVVVALLSVIEVLFLLSNVDGFFKMR